jgi:hypothetical protein
MKAVQTIVPGLLMKNGVFFPSVYAASIFFKITVWPYNFINFNH